MLLFGLLQSLPADYAVVEQKWRETRETNLKAPRGWLSVDGLDWLVEGPNTIGSEPSCTVRLPASAPARYGTLYRQGKSVTLRQAGEGDMELSPDTSESPDYVTVGDVQFVIVERGERIGVRVYNPKSEFQKKFGGLKWYPVDPKYRIKAKYVPYPKPRTLQILNVLGDLSDSSNPGYVTFMLGGEQVKLDALDNGGQFFFNFQDGTNGKGTYPGGRFLYTDKASDGFVILDFNRAYCPPCAYTDYATCPLPPRTNRLKFSIPAGEMDPGVVKH